MSNLSLNLFINRPNDSSIVNTVIQLPFLNKEQNNTIELLYDPIYRSNLVYTFTDPFPYTSSSNITIFGNEVNTGTNVVTENVVVLSSNYNTKTFANGTFMIQTSQDSGALINDSAPIYPIYYSVNLTENVVSFMNVNVTIQNSSSVQSVIERLNGDGATQRLLKTNANRLLQEKYGFQVTPASLSFHSTPPGYHDSNLTNIIRIDTEWRQQSNRYTILIESTDASSRSSNRPIQIVLPQNAPISNFFPIIIYQKNDEYLPLIHLGSLNESGSFVLNQVIRLDKYTFTQAISGTDYHVDLKLLSYDINQESWNIISKPNVSQNEFSNLILNKTNQVQKHFLAQEDQVRLSFNGVRLQTLSLKGNQFQFITAKSYLSSVGNADNTKRILPQRYFSFHRNSLFSNMNQQELFEDIIGSGDVIRQINTSSNSTILNSQTDTQNLTTEFGNGTTSFGSDSYIFNGNHYWLQDIPLQWNEYVQSDTNLTLYSPFTGLPTTTQTMNTSFILNINAQKTGNYDDVITLFATKMYIPQTSTDTIANLMVEIQMIDNSSVSNGFDLQSVVTQNNTQETNRIATNLTTSIWNRLGIELPLTWNRVSDTWTLQNAYARVASYHIPNNSVLDGTQKLSLNKVYPSSGEYKETNLTQSISFSSIGNADVSNISVQLQIGNSTSFSISDNLTIQIDELEVFTGPPILSNTIGGSMIRNPYH